MANEDLCNLVDIRDADPTAAALLIECRGKTPANLEARIAEVSQALERARLPLGRTAAEPKGLQDYPFHHNPAEYNVFWDVRKGLIPIVGAAREPGESLLEASPVSTLSNGLSALTLVCISESRSRHTPEHKPEDAFMHVYMREPLWFGRCGR
jgi:FAD/FMN-containing dehydrogenase